MSGLSGGSGGLPVLCFSTNAVQFFRRLRRVLFRSSFALLFDTGQTFPFLFRSSDFSVPLSFPFSAPQTFPFLFRSSFPFFFTLVIFETVGFSEGEVIS